MNELYIRGLKIEWNQVGRGSYLRDIEAISSIDSLEFNKPVTFLVGENGTVESNADRKMTVTVEGGELLGFGSANPCHKEQYHTGTFTSYYGRALAVVRKTAESLSVTVCAEGLSPVTTVVR